MGKSNSGRELGKGISQRKNGLYVGRYTDRFGKRKTLYSRDLKELKRDLANEQHMDALEQNVEYSDMTVDQWFEVWFESYKVGKLKPSTLAVYNNCYNKCIKPVFGRRRIDSVKTVDLNLFFAKLQGDGYASRTIRRVKMLLSDLFDKAALDEIILRNPVKAATIGKGKILPARVLSMHEQKVFFKYSEGTFYDRAFKVAISTGMRSGELFALEESDIDFERMEISVNKTLGYAKYIGEQRSKHHVGSTKTATGMRKIPMTESLAKILREQIAETRKLKERKGVNSSFIFLTRRGTPMGTVVFGNAITAIVDKINTDGNGPFERFTAHTFRHTFATRCIEAGVNYKVLQSLLGHTNLQTTMDLYVHVLPETKSSELEKVNFFEE